jgi:hypothetical protein
VANHIASIAVLAALTFVPTGLHAQSSILTADQQKKLTVLMDAHGNETALARDVTAALGMTKGNEVVTLRQLTVDAHPIHHAYIPLSNGGLLLIAADATIAKSYRFDANQKLIGAVSKNGDPAGPVIIPNSEAERNAQLELT